MTLRIGGVVYLLVALAILPGCGKKMNQATCLSWRTHAQEVLKAEMDRFVRTASPEKLSELGPFWSGNYKLNMKELDSACDNLSTARYPDPISDENAACFAAARTGAAFKACKLPAHSVLEEAFANFAERLAEATDR